MAYRSNRQTETKATNRETGNFKQDRVKNVHIIVSPDITLIAFRKKLKSLFNV